MKIKKVKSRVAARSIFFYVVSSKNTLKSYLILPTSLVLISFLSMRNFTWLAQSKNIYSNWVSSANWYLTPCLQMTSSSGFMQMLNQSGERGAPYNCKKSKVTSFPFYITVFLNNYLHIQYSYCLPKLERSMALGLISKVFYKQLTQISDKKTLDPDLKVQWAASFSLFY